MLSTLIDNKARVQEITKEQAPHVDDICKPFYLVRN